MATRISAELDQMLAEAIDKHAMGDEVKYDIALAIPGINQQTGGPMPPVAQIFLFVPGPILGSQLNAAFVFQNPSKATQEECNNAIREVLEDMRQERTRQLQVGSNGQAPQGPQGLSRPDQIIPPRGS